MLMKYLTTTIITILLHSIFHDASASVWDTISYELSSLYIDDVADIESDHNGNMWLAYTRGLAIFNGTDWIAHTLANSSVLPSISLSIDNNNCMWTGTNRGIKIYADTLLTPVQKNLGDNPPQIIDKLLHASDGTIWIASSGNGIYSFDGTTWTNYYPSQLQSNYYKDLLEDKQKRIWANSRSNGVACFDGTNWTEYDSSNSPLNTNKIYTMVMDSSGALWFSSVEEVAQPQHGLYRFDGQTWTNYNTSNSNLPHNDSYGMVVDKAGFLWIVTSKCDFVKFNGDTFEIKDNSALPNGGAAAEHMIVDNHNRIIICFRHLPIIVYDQHKDDCGSITRVIFDVPFSGKSYKAGQTIPILWSTVGCIDTVFIEYRIGSSPWQSIAGPVPNNMPYHWIAPETLSSLYQIRVRKSDDQTVSDTSGRFSVIASTGNNPPVITIRPDILLVAPTTIFTWTAVATDPDGDQITFTFRNLPDWITASGNELTMSPDSDDTDTVITVIASDTHGGNDSITIRVLVRNPVVNDLKKDLTIHKAISPPKKIEVFDISGCLVRVVPNSTVLSIHTTKDLRPGSYIIKTTSGKLVSYRKILVNR